MPSTTDLFPLTRSLHNTNIPGNSKTIHSFLMYYELVKSNLWSSKTEGLTELEFCGEWKIRKTSFCIFWIWEGVRRKTGWVFHRVVGESDYWKLGEKRREGGQGRKDRMKASIWRWKLKKYQRSILPSWNFAWSWPWILQYVQSTLAKYARVQTFFFLFRK